MSLSEQNEEPFSTLEVPVDIRVFLEGILKEADLTLDKEMHEDMIKQLFMRLDQFLTQRIVEELSDEDLEVFITLVEQKRPMADVQEFMFSHVPNAREVFTNAFIAFREFYLGTTKGRIMSPQEEIVELLKRYAPNIRREFRRVYQESLP